MTLRRNFLVSLAAPLMARAQSRATGALPQPDDPAYWARVRDQFPLARDKVFFNNGTIGAMPKVVLDRTVEHLRKMATDVADWDYKPGDEWIAGYGPMTEIRTKMARLLNAGVTEIALTENVTAAMSYIAAGMDVEPGSEILISDQEHPRRTEPVAERGEASRRQRADGPHPEAGGECVRSDGRLPQRAEFAHASAGHLPRDHGQRRDSAGEADVRGSAVARHLHGDRRRAGGGA